MKKGVREKLAEITEIPKDLAMNLPRAVLLGNHELQVENYKGLLEYSEEIIRLSFNQKQMKIIGSGLYISRLDADNIFLSGKINKIEFCLSNGENV